MKTQIGPRARLRALAFAVCSVACLGTANAQPHPEWTLYTPFSGTTTFLLDLDNSVVQTWPSAFRPGLSVYLVEDGSILRTASDSSVQPFGGGGTGGRIQRIAWDGTLEWNYVVAGPDHVQHHDIEILPNGNILAIIWERYTRAEAIAMGRDPNRVGTEVWSEAILEIEPVGATGGNIVWEWHVWDHLVQDFDANLPNFGDPADFPGRIDINFGPTVADWLHFNGMDYNAELDQIVMSSRTLSEIWVISHDPDASGDFVYRWGNPQAYNRGGSQDQRLFGQHDPEWIPEGLPGAGNITIFSNGDGRGFSTADEIDTGVNKDGTYDLPPNDPYAPAEPAWSCSSIDGQGFYSIFMSGVQRLANGNTLICIALDGRFVEIDENCNSVWSYNTGTTFRATRIDKRDPRLANLLFCAADMDDNGTVDADDFFDYLDLFAADDPQADLNLDGTIDADDFFMYLDFFVAGCP